MRSRARRASAILALAAVLLPALGPTGALAEPPPEDDLPPGLQITPSPQVDLAPGLNDSDEPDGPATTPDGGAAAPVTAAPTPEDGVPAPGDPASPDPGTEAGAPVSGDPAEAVIAAEPGGAAGAPAAAAPALASPTSGGSALEGQSPFCGSAGLSAEAQANCAATQSIARPYPLSSYGIDSQIEVGFENLGNFIPMAIQSLVGTIWHGFLQGINAALMLLEWAFSLDLVGDSLTSIKQSITHLNDDILGESWLLAGIAIAGLIGIWTGLVRRKTMETLGSLAATVLLICASLLIIHQPESTVGKVSGAVNDTSLEALQLASGESVDSGAGAYAGATQGLFDTIVLKPWCALQFGDVDYCFERPGKVCFQEEGGDAECNPFDGTVADAWLTHPAGSQERDGLFYHLKETDKPKSRLMDAEGTLDRVGLLLLVGAGCLGAIFLLLYLAARLVLAAMETLFFLLVLPIILILPCFGEAGRNAFMGCVKRGGSAVISKLVYAFFFTFVILLTVLISGLDGIGWYARWLLLAGFWWGVFLKRHELVGFIEPGGGRGGSKLSSAYYGLRMLREATGAATALPRKAMRMGRAGARRVGHNISANRRASRGALKQDAGDQLRRRGEAALEAQRARAEKINSDPAGSRDRLEEMGTEQKEVDRDLEGARARRRGLEARRRSLKGRGKAAEREKVSGQLATAWKEERELGARSRGLKAERATYETALSNPGAFRRGRASESEINDWVQKRERDLADGFQDADAAGDRQLFERAGDGASGRVVRRAKRELERGPPSRARAAEQWTRENKRAEQRERRRSRMGRR